MFYIIVSLSVVDRHRFDADPDSTFHFVPRSGSESYQIIRMLENQIFFLLLFTTVPVNIVRSFSSAL
jgi:hypothetical protein